VYVCVCIVCSIVQSADLHLRLPTDFII